MYHNFITKREGNMKQKKFKPCYRLSIQMLLQAFLPPETSKIFSQIALSCEYLKLLFGVFWCFNNVWSISIT